MYTIRKILKYFSYTFVYLIISLASAYGVILFSVNNAKGNDMGAETQLPQQISSMVEHFSEAQALDLNLSADIHSGADSYTINLDAIVDLSRGLDNIKAQGSLTAIIGEQTGIVQTTASSEPQAITVNFNYQNDYVYLDMLGGKMVMQTSSLIETITELLAIMDIDLSGTGITDILNMPIKDMLGMLSNIKDEQENVEDNTILMTIALPMVGDAVLTCDPTYKLQGLSSDMVISDDMTVGVDSNISYPEVIDIETKDQNSYINIGNLLQVAKPLATYLKQDTFAFSFKAQQQLQNLEYQTLAEGNVSLDIKNKAAKLALKAFGDYANIYFMDKSLFIEYKNAYAKFDLIELELVTDFLNNSFGIEIPEEIIDTILALLNGEEITLPSGIDLSQLDLTSVDLSMIENVTIKDNSTIVTVRDIGVVRISTKNQALSTLAYSGFGYQTSAQILSYKDFNLTQDKTNYIDLASFIPTIENALSIAKADVISGEFKTTVAAQDIEINFAYSPAKAIATASTSIFDLKVDIYLAQGKVYVNVEDKFKFISNTATFVDDMMKFLKNVGVDIANADPTAVLDKIMVLFDPSITPLFITSLTETENGLIITLFNDTDIVIANATDELTISSTIMDLAVATTIKAGGEIVIPDLIEAEYTDFNVVLDLAATAYNKGITKLLNPALNTFKTGNIGLSATLPFAETQLPAQIMFSLNDRTLTLTSEINDLTLQVIYQNGNFFFEYGNLYLQFALADFDKLETFISDNFNITLPSSMIDNIIEIIVNEDLSIKDMLAMFAFDFDLSSIDKSIFDNITITNNQAIIRMDDINLTLNFTENEFVSIVVDEISAEFVEFKNVSLSSYEESYLDATALLPSIENAIKILRSDVASASIKTIIDSQEFKIDVAYSLLDGKATAYANIFGLDLNVYAVDGKIYINLADKFKFVSSLDTFAADITSFLENVGFDLSMLEKFDVMQTMQDIFNPNLNQLFISEARQTQNGLILTFFNGMTVVIVNNTNTLAIGSIVSDLPLTALLKVGGEVTLPDIVEDDYTDFNIILDIAAAAYNKGLTSLVDPALNTFMTGKVGLEMAVTVEGNEIPALAMISLADKTMAVSSEFNSTQFKLVFNGFTFFIEYGNLYFKASLSEYDEVEQFLESNFDITLPSEMIKKVISLITAESITPDELLNTFDLNFNLANFDLSIFDNITVNENDVVVTLENNTITLNYTAEKLTGVNFNDQLTASFVEFEEVNLSSEENNYIKFTSFLPTAQNVLDIIANDVISGSINTTIEEQEIEISFAYSQSENKACAYTQILGIDVNIYMTNGKVFVNVQDKFKFISDTSTFMDDIQAFLTSVGLEMNIDSQEIFAELANLLNPAVNALFIKNFVQNDNTTVITLFNDIAFTITNADNAITLASQVENVPFSIHIEGNGDVVIPQLVEEDYTDFNIILDIAAAAYNKGLTSLAEPALNTFMTGKVGLEMAVTVDGNEIPALAMISLADKTMAVSSEFNSTQFKLVFNGFTFFIEYGNLYFKASLSEYDEVEQFLESNFDITLPSEMIKKVISLITAESITPDELLNTFDLNFNLATFDLSIFDNITVNENDVVVTLENNTISLYYTTEKLTGVKFNDQLTASFVEFEEVTLSSEENSYIKFTSFLPTAQNVLDIMANDVISGSITTTIEEQDIEISFAYSQSENKACAYTQILGIDVNIYMTNGKVFVNVQDKFKFISDTSTFMDDIQAFLTNVGLEMNIDSQEIFTELANLLNPAVNALFIKNFVQNDNTTVVTLFNDIAFTITNTDNAITLASQVENIPFAIHIEGNGDVVIPQLVEEDYTDINVLLNLAAAAHNAGLTKLLTPAIDTLAAGNLGATFDFSYDEITVSGHISINITDLSLGINVNVRGLDVNIIILSDDVVYIEFGNVYAKFALADLPKVGEILEEYFDISLPFAAILEILNDIRTGEFNPIDALNTLEIEIDLEKFDLAYFDSVEVSDESYTLPLEGIGQINLKADETTLQSVGFEGFGIKANGYLSEYKVFDLSLLKNEYIDLALLLPTAENILDIISYNTLSGQIVIYDRELDLNIPIDYVVAKDSEVYVSFTTNIYGAHISGKYYKEKVYLEFAESVSIVVDVLNLPAAIQEVMDSAGKNIQTDLFVTIKDILDKLLSSNSGSLISTAVGLFDSVKSTFDKTSIEILIKNLVSTDNGLVLTLHDNTAITLANVSAGLTGATAIDYIDLNVSVYGSNDTIVIPTLNDSDYIPIENILELVKAFFNMTHKDDFNIQGTLHIVGSLIGIDINMDVDVNAQVKIVDGKVMFQAVIGEIPAIVGVNNDVPYKFGDTESGSDRYVYLYFDGGDLYIYRSENVDVVFGASKRHYEKCTKISADTLLADPMYYLQYMLGFTDTIMAEI